MVVESATGKALFACPMPESADFRERSLLQRLRGREAEAFDVLVREYAGRLLATARRFLRCEADCADAVQDAFLAAFKNVDSFTEAASLSTWLHRILINCCLMKLRSQRRRPTVSICELLPQFGEDGAYLRDVRPWRPEGTAESPSSETRAQVRACIESLPEPYRVVLMLRDIEECGTEETAALLGISCANVKTRLHRARQALRELLEAAFADTRSGAHCVGAAALERR